MSKGLRIIVMVLMGVFLVAASVASLADPDLGKGTSVKAVQKKINQVSPDGAVVVSDGGVTKVITDINKLPLKDNASLYQYDDPGSVVTMYLTVRRGNDLEKTNHSWQEVNDSSKFILGNFDQIAVPKAEAILQVGDENGPLPGAFGYGDTATNAIVQIRGNSTSVSPQKSYKISIFDSAGEWQGQKTISLNKHIFDPTRVKNKLAFDLLKDIPNMVSLRTQFVHLYVKDETTDPPGQGYEDYGLFTQIEQPNGKFLKNHLLDRYGQLYKANMFEFYRYPEEIRMADDPLYDEAAFSTVLEIKGNKDHTKLIAMLDDVNNGTIPIEKTFDRYFDEENYFTWMAFNILVGNTDTNSQNFYLYSPQNGQKWYFIPWDYDGAFDRRKNSGKTINKFEQGIATYWGDVLHRRVLSVPEYREKLDDKIHELLVFITPERLNTMLNVYRPVTDQYVTRTPDLLNLPVTVEGYDLAYSQIPEEVNIWYEMYKESLESPLPYFLGTPQSNGDTVRFNWDEAYDFDAQDISYHFELSKNWDFSQRVSSIRLKNITHVEVPMLEPGTYFWRVVATNEDGKSQYPFDYYIDSDGLPHYGLKYLYVIARGEFVERILE